MFTSPNPKALWSELSSGKPTATAQRAYFRSRARNRLYDFVLGKFVEREIDGLTKADLARRMGTRPEVVNRYLANPGNWTIDTVSDLLLGISAEELKPASQPVYGRSIKNRSAKDVFEEQAKPPVSKDTNESMKFDWSKSIKLDARAA